MTVRDVKFDSKDNSFTTILVFNSDKYNNIYESFYDNSSKIELYMYEYKSACIRYILEDNNIAKKCTNIICIFYKIDGFKIGVAYNNLSSFLTDISTDFSLL
jgi:hypothetical protein